MLQVRNVEGNEKVVLGREHFSSPNIPAGRIADRRMTKAVDWEQSVEDVFSDADLHIWR